MKRTPWFPASVKPVHVGWYEASIGNCMVRRRYFDGNRWRFGGKVGVISDLFESYSGSQWRGLTEPAK